MYSLISVGRTEALTKKVVWIIETITFPNLCSPCVGRTNVHRCYFCQCICNAFWYFRYIFQLTRWHPRLFLVGCCCCFVGRVAMFQCGVFRAHKTVLQRKQNQEMNGHSQRWTGCDQLKPLKLCKFVFTRDIKNAKLLNTRSPPVRLLLAGFDPPSPLETESRVVRLSPRSHNN